MNFEENGVPNTVSIDLQTASLIQEQATENPHERTHATRQQNENQQGQMVVEDAKGTRKGDTNVLLEYLESRVMRHMDTPQGRRYVVR